MQEAASNPVEDTPAPASPVYGPPAPGSPLPGSPAPQPLPYAKRPPRARVALYAIAALGVLIGALAREPIVDLLRPREADPAPAQLKLPPPPQAATQPVDYRAIALARAKPHLDWANAESQRAAEEHLKALDTFFADTRKNTPAFAKDVLNFRSKWFLVVDKLPFTRDGRHEQYLRDRFAARLFRPEQLVQSVRAIVAGYLASVQSTEGIMLVRIRADISDLPQEQLPLLHTDELMRQAFEQALAEAAQQAKVEVGGDAVRLVATEVGTTVVMAIGVRLGVSAGILSAGAASSWATLGVGVVAGFIIDYAVSSVWDWWKKPAANLALRMDARLNAIHRMMVEGDGQTVGLRAKLQELHEKRAQVRQQAVENLIGGRQ